jgi:hypothetical protein
MRTLLCKKIHRHRVPTARDFRLVKEDARPRAVSTSYCKEKKTKRSIIRVNPYLYAHASSSLREDATIVFP